MDVRLPDGTVIKNVPDGMSKADLTAKLKANGYDVSKLEAPVAPPPSEIPAPRAEPTTYEKVREFVAPTVGALGAAGGAALGIPLGPAGIVGGAGLGYGMAQEALNLADIYVGGKAPRQGAAAVVEPLRNVVEGAAMETGGRVVAPLIGKAIGYVGGKVADIRQMPNQLAAQITRESLGSPEQIAAARAAMQQAEGLGLTAQQALARANVIAPTTQATIERAVKRAGAPGVQPTVDTRAAIEAAQESARRTTIKGVTPDLEAAVNARRAASKPLYEAADKAVVPIDAELADVITRMPEGTLSKAAEIAKMEGRPFIMGKTAPAQMVETGVLDVAGKPIMRKMPGQTAEITGESLHYVKRALSDIAYGQTALTGAGRDTQLAARGLLNDYVKVFETKVPEYGQARQIFSDLSAPVNQAQVLKEMVSVLEKPGGGERIGPFLNVLGRGEQAMLKRAGGRGGVRFESLSEVLTPDQLVKVRDVARQLETDAAIGQQITAGQQRASDLIKDELASYRIPNPLNTLVTAANKVLDILGTKVGSKTIQKLATASLTSKSFDELLATLPAAERNQVLKAIGDPLTWTQVGPAIVRAAAMPATPTNALAPTQENQNALSEPFKVEIRGFGPDKP
jgi:histone H3/H4